MQRKRDRYDKTEQDLLLKEEALKKKQQENDQRKQEIDEKEQVIEEIKQATDENRWASKEIQEEIEEEFPYLRGLEVKENAEHPMPEVKQPTSAASLVCLLGQAFPSTQLENKENVECPVPHKEKPKESARYPVFPVNHVLSNTQMAIEEYSECPVNQVD